MSLAVLRVACAPCFLMVRRPFIETSTAMVLFNSGTKIRRFWRLALRRTLPVGLNCVARVRLEYRPPIWVDLPVMMQARAIVAACYHVFLNTQSMESLFVVVVLIFSVIAHEVAHGYAANALGDPTARLAGRLTLNPLPHIDIVGSVIIPALLVFSNAGLLFGWAKPVPYNPYNLRDQRYGEAIVAVAGSATNILLALVFALIARV